MAKKLITKNDPLVDFESTMDELENLVESMESGDLTLEESMKSFELGIGLTRTCQKVLCDAEQKIEILSKDMQPELFDLDQQ